jgi:hypothetical protein
MFTGVVVESFAYVYQMPGGASLNREDMRELLPCSPLSDLAGPDANDATGAFKRVWAEFDTGRTGYIKRRDLIKFFSVSLHRSQIFLLEDAPTSLTSTATHWRLRGPALSR